MLPVIATLLLSPVSASYPAPIQPCNVELTGGGIFTGAPYLPAAIGLKAAEKRDARVAHPDANHWEWNYHTATRELLPREGEINRPSVVHIACRALDAEGRRAWVNEGGGEDVPAATLLCTLNNRFKNGERSLAIALNADLEVLAAKQLWRHDEGMLLCHLPRKPPSEPAAPAPTTPTLPVPVPDGAPAAPTPAL